MLDFGWAELLFIMAIAVLVIGPQDIPKIMYNIGRLVRRLQYVRFALSRQFEEFMQQHDLEDLQRGVNFEASDYKDQDYDEAAADQDLAVNIPDEEDRGKTGEETPSNE